MATNQKEFRLDFSSRVIEHLGVKLYQNKPTNVIAEFLSNSWDADAENVVVELKGDSQGQLILVTDNGVGMSRDELTDQFLIIGRNRRSDPNEKSLGGRDLMGRKGIGKLAGFGIASVMDVLSCPNWTRRKKPSAGEIKCYWLRFSLPEIIKQGAEGSYLPEVVADGISPTELEARLVDQGLEAQFQVFLDNLKKEQGGVSIRLSNTTLKKSINPETLLRSMGRRFTVTMLRPDFTVTINGKQITPEDALPPLQEFKIGTWEKPIEENILCDGIERNLRYWVSFVDLKDSDWSIENAGVGIYAHGKIAQDRPFFFDVKGKEILSRYMYGVIEADWLDELPEDVVSTDRRSLDWETTATADFHNWGAKKLLSWLEDYRKWRLSLPKKEIVEKIREQNVRLTATEEEALADLLSEVFVDLGNNEEAKEKTTNRITSAWTHEPTRRLTQTLWKEVFSTLSGDQERVVELIDQLNKSLVPEALSLAVTMAQRIAAITSMTKMISEEKTETHLQRLIEKFPWLIDPKNEFLTANQTIRTLIEKKHKPDTETGQWALSKNDGNLKPDFVFLADPSIKRQIVVYELKGPEAGKTLQPVEYDQLVQYLTILDRQYNNPEMEVKGILIGHDKGGFSETDKRIEVRRWSEVLNEARFLHVTYLGALLKASQPGLDDVRLEQISDFGGKEATELLKKYSEQLDFPDEILAELSE